MEMVMVNSALRQKDVIEIVESIEIENKKVFKFIYRKGIRIFFECNYSDMKKACHIVKWAIINTKVGQVLFFNVVDCKEYPWVKCPSIKN